MDKFCDMVFCFVVQFFVNCKSRFLYCRFACRRCLLAVSSWSPTRLNQGEYFPTDTLRLDTGACLSEEPCCTVKWKFGRDGRVLSGGRGWKLCDQSREDCGHAEKRAEVGKCWHQTEWSHTCSLILIIHKLFTFPFLVYPSFLFLFSFFLVSQLEILLYIVSSNDLCSTKECG